MKGPQFSEGDLKESMQAGFLGIHTRKIRGQEYGIMEHSGDEDSAPGSDSGSPSPLRISLGNSLRSRTEEGQKQKYLFPSPRASSWSSGGFTEPDHGSDITLMNHHCARSEASMSSRGKDRYHQCTIANSCWPCARPT